MAIVINGSGTVTGISVGGLPDGIVDAGTLATNSVDSAELIDGSIDNSHLADDAVGLAEMASGTDGNIISYDASGNPVAIATGTDGQVLTSTGAGSPPAFEDAAGGGGGGGAWTYLSTITASGSATVDFSSSFTTTYDDYMVVCNGIIGSSGGTELYAQTKANGTWLTSATYYYHVKELRTSGEAYAAEYAQGATGYLLFPLSSLATGVNDGLDFIMHLPKCYDAGMRSVWTESAKGGNSGKGGGMFGNINSTSITDGLRFYASSGNLSGSFKFYGLAKS